MLNTTVGDRYRVVRLLGEGGMGAVYEADDTATGARVAVKVVTSDVVRDETLLGRFDREIRAAMSISTPHIVRVLDASRDAASGLPFLVMEYLEGEDLRHLLKRLGPLPPDLALRIGVQVGLGVQAAHENRIVHRDIKPANIFLAKGPPGERTVKLLDFGIAKITSGLPGERVDTSALTRTGSMLGSPLYMAPEQARGHKDIDHRADIWSLGIVLYKALSGRAPHEEIDTMGDLIVAICTELPQPLREVAPWVSVEVEHIVHRTLQLDPADRFQSAMDLVAALGPHLPRGVVIREETLLPLHDDDRRRVASAAPGPARGRMMSFIERGERGGVDATGAALPLIATPVPPRRSLSPVFLGLGAGLAMLLGGLVAYLLAQRPRAPDAAVSVAAPAADAAASAGPVSAPPPRASLHKVAVMPHDATILVNGMPAEIVEGAVEIVGLPGSVHQVNVRAGDREKDFEVIVTEQGTRPTQIDLGAPVSAPGTGVLPPPRSTRPAAGAAPTAKASSGEMIFFKR